jgi:hypothetical protein
MDRKRNGAEEGADDNASDQDFPNDAGVERAGIACGRKPIGLRKGTAAWHDNTDQASDRPRRNRILAASLPRLANHQSPANSSTGVSGFTGWDRVNASSCDAKT